MEAGWILALMLLPVFFNIQSGRPFEPDKTALLRLVAADGRRRPGAVLPDRYPADAPRPAGARWRESPLMVCSLAYTAAASSPLMSISRA